MYYVLARYLKHGTPNGKPYLFSSEEPLKHFDLVDLPSGKHGIVINDDYEANAEMAKKFGEDKVKTVKKHIDESEVNTNERNMEERSQL